VLDQLALDVGVYAARRSALISDDGLYRYRLDRRWSPGPTVAWVMLNPSAADADTDDATLRRATAFSRSWGFGALRVVNLYAYRATEPAELWKAAEPVGPDNDRHITRAVSCVEIVAAWGANARPDRVAAVLEVLAKAPGAGRVHALATTKAGQPRHPLYLRGDLVMQRWEAPDA
jgi:hypothetical protein